MIEKDFSPETKEQLEKMGYKCVTRGAIGRTELIKVLYGNAANALKIEAAADKRGDDSVAGY
jgi:gamma-glutamyltranspeptidase/glutathione hydrolase